MNKKIKSTKGITLIALIVTIIVLIILAGISVNLLVGENGLITRAKDAAVVQEKADIISKIRLDIAAKQVDTKGEITLSDIETILGTYGEVTKNANGMIESFTPQGKAYSIPFVDIFEGELAQLEDIPVQENIISKSESYVGCYADVDGDGDIDGIIYVDLIAQSGQTRSHTPGSDYSEFTIPEVNSSNLNDYAISDETQVDNRFDNTPRRVIKLAQGNTKTDEKSRFYVMGLENINFDEYEDSDRTYLYSNYSSPDEEDYFTSMSFGSGMSNTQNLLQIWNSEICGEKSESDWLNCEIAENWFIPTVEEWNAFCYALDIHEAYDDGNDNTVEANYANGRYNNLDKYFFTSYLDFYIWEIDLDDELRFYQGSGDDICALRLSTKF